MAKKILFFIESLGGGGAEKVLTTLVKHIDKHRFDITVCTVMQQGIYTKEVEQYVSLISLIPFAQSKLIYKVLYKLIYNHLPMKWVYKLFVPKGNDIEIAFCEGFATKLLAASPCKHKIAWVHIDLIANPWTQGLVFKNIKEERCAYSSFTKVVAVSEWAAKCFSMKFNIPAITLNNPIDSEEIISKSTQGIPLSLKPNFRIVSAGRLVPQKGYERLIRIAGQLKREGFLFELWIVGDGSMRIELEQLIEENGVKDNTTLCGFQTNPYPYIKSGDLFVCSSRSEGYSTAVTEALILGIPVIATRCSGMDELLGANNQWGIVCDNQEKALLNSLREILIDKQLYQWYKNKALARGTDFSIQRLMKPIENILR